MAVLSTTQARRGHANALITTADTPVTPNLYAGGTESCTDDSLRLVNQMDVFDMRTYMQGDANDIRIYQKLLKLGDHLTMISARLWGSDASDPRMHIHSDQIDAVITEKR